MSLVIIGWFNFHLSRYQQLRMHQLCVANADCCHVSAAASRTGKTTITYIKPAVGPSFENHTHHSPCRRGVSCDELTRVDRLARLVFLRLIVRSIMGGREERTTLCHLSCWLSRPSQGLDEAVERKEIGWTVESEKFPSGCLVQ